MLHTCLIFLKTPKHDFIDTLHLLENSSVFERSILKSVKKPVSKFITANAVWGSLTVRIINPFGVASKYNSLPIRANELTAFARTENTNFINDNHGKY